MKLIVIVFLAALTACQDYNSNTNDVEKYSKVTLTGSADFTPAYYIIQQRCTSCHTSSVHSEWASYTKEQDWIDKGKVTKNDPESSNLILRIINHGPGGDMPQGMGPLPNDEYQQLVDWVTNIP
jgi:uncharacterized membrane protein